MKWNMLLIIRNVLEVFTSHDWQDMNVKKVIIEMPAMCELLMLFIEM